MWVFIFIADYYSDTLFLRTLFLNIGFLVQLICSLLFIYILEKYKIFLKRFLFTKIFAIILILFIFIFIIAIDFTFIISISYWLVMIVFFTIYLKEFNLDFCVKTELRNLKLDLLKFCLGIALVAIGYFFCCLAIVSSLIFRLLGVIFQLIGFIFLSLFFISIPSFSEYNWKDKIESIYITIKSGLFVYKKFFRKNVKSIDDHLFSGSITSVKMMLSNLTNKEGVSIIEKEGKVVIIQAGKFINGILICDERLYSLQILLSNFIKKIEDIYQNILENWNGDLSIFSPLDNIAQEIFQ